MILLYMLFYFSNKIFFCTVIFIFYTLSSCVLSKFFLWWYSNFSCIASLPIVFQKSPAGLFQSVILPVDVYLGH